MGLYGSPDVGNLYTEEKKVKKERKKRRPQTNKWVWVAILLWNIFFVVSIGVRFDSIMTVIIFDSAIMAIISSINLIRNLIKRESIKDDIIFLISSILAVLVLMLILGTVINMM